jgi:hypothetical protein
MQRLLAHPVVRFLLFWVLLGLLCAALNESSDLAEWLLAVGVGALVAAVGTLASRALGVRLGLPRRPVTLLLVPFDIAHDTWQLVARLPRLRAPGRRLTRTVPVGSPVEEAWTVLVASAAPGAFVVDATGSGEHKVKLALHARTDPGPALRRTLAKGRAR